MEKIDLAGSRLRTVGPNRRTRRQKASSYTLAHPGRVVNQAPRSWRALEPLEPRLLLSGAILGQVFNDIDNNGTFEPANGEFPLADQTIYLDLNENGRLDTNVPTLLTFQQGVGGYTDAYDIFLRESDTQLNGSSAVVRVGVPDGGGTQAQGLMRFDDIFGSPTNRIPQGSAITSATLTLEVIVPTDNGATAVHRMAHSWDEDDIWDDWIGGISADDAEAIATTDASISDPIATGTLTIDVTSSVQSWSNGADNQGWVFMSTSGNGWSFHSSQEATMTVRPQLKVLFVRDEPSAISDENGQYGFTDLPPDRYAVAQLTQIGWEQIFPDPLVNPAGTVRIASNLNRPIFVKAPPADYDRLFIVEQHTGQIKILNLHTGLINSTPYLDLTGLSTGNEQGLLGLAFHPDYTTNGLFYVNFIDTAGTTNICRYKVSDLNGDVVDTSSATTIATFSQPFGNHNGGWLGFGPDGLLYVATGDGGNAGDPQNRAQDTTAQWLGKILRIDVDGDDFPADTNRNYAIPADNPFVGVEDDDEIWAYGLRNPWRASFDRATGDFYMADVGQNSREEVNFQPAHSPGGENYGWRVMEADQCFDNSQANGNRACGDPNMADPIHVYGHTGAPDGGFSITGGYVYRGQITELRGHYFFADYLSEQIWSFRFDGTTLSELTNRTAQFDPETSRIDQISSFGEDALGNLYIVDLGRNEPEGGEIFKIVQSSYPGIHVVVLNPDQSAQNINFGNRAVLGSGQIHGMKFNDLNSDSAFDPADGESPLADWTIYLDLNENDQLDTALLTTLSFQEGVDGYANTQDTVLRQADTTPKGEKPFVRMKNSTAIGLAHQGLLRFENIFGNGPNRIPLGSGVVSATLMLHARTPSTDGTTAVHRMQATWNENDTWDVWTNGISADDVEAIATADTSIPAPISDGMLSIDVTGSLQAWSSGLDNHGWLFMNPSPDDWSFYSSEEAVTSSRPQLEVTFLLDEPFAVTDEVGQYAFTDLAPQSYTVAELMQAGWKQTFPGSPHLPPSPFHIDVIFESEFTESQQQAFAGATARWSQIIIGDLPDVYTNIGLVDDVAVDVRSKAIDGSGGTVARAGPSQHRAGSRLPSRGTVEFDTADLPQLESNDRLEAVIVHELGHVLGFGTIWEDLGLFTGAGSSNPRFTGSGATAEYNNIFGLAETSVPVEETGGVGTRDSHWRESVFDNEMMTGFVDSGTDPLSRITVASMADIGYEVNLDLADLFLPSLVGGNSALSNTVLAGTHRVILEPGQSVQSVDFGNHDTTAGGVHLRGDANLDNRVSADDFASVQAHFGKTGGPDLLGDANGDGTVSADDYASVQARFGNTSEIQSTFSATNTAMADKAAPPTHLSDETLSGTRQFMASHKPIWSASDNGATVTMNAGLNSLATGSQQGEIAIAGNEGILDLAIKSGATLVPKIEVRGNNRMIVDGDTKARTDNHTSFGSAGVDGASVIYTFTIKNIGSRILNLTADQIVKITGPDAADFTVSQQPSSTVASDGDTTTFQILFDPRAKGRRNATIVIANDNSDKSSYEFAIRGKGTISDRDRLPCNVHLDGVVPTDDYTSVQAHFDNTAGIRAAFSAAQIIPRQVASITIIQQPTSLVFTSGSTTTSHAQSDSIANSPRSTTIASGNDEGDESLFQFSFRIKGRTP